MVKHLSKPLFWIKFCSLVTQLELENTRRINRSESLTCTHFLTSMHVYRSKVTINRYVKTMTHHYDRRATCMENTTYLTHKNTTHRTSRCTLNIYTIAIETNIVHSCYIILTEMSYNPATHRHR